MPSPNNYIKVGSRHYVFFTAPTEVKQAYETALKRRMASGGSEMLSLWKPVEERGPWENLPIVGVNPA